MSRVQNIGLTVKGTDYKSAPTTDVPNATYEVKSVKEMTYTSHTVNGKKLVRPLQTVSKDYLGNLSSLSKNETTDYIYNTNDPFYLDTVKTTNAHGFRQKAFSNYSYGVPLTVKEMASESNDCFQTDYEYDNTRRFIKKKTTQNTDAVQYEYDGATGNVSEVTDINGLITSYEYDNLGRKIKTIYPDKTEENVTFTRGSNSNIPNSAYNIAVSSTGKPTAIVYYDKLGRELVSGAVGLSYKETKYTYKGEVEKVSLPYESLNTPNNQKIWHTYAYDAYGRIIREKGPYTDLCYAYSISLNAKTHTATVNDNLRATSYSKTFDATSRLKYVIDENNQRIDYAYSFAEDDNNKVCDLTEITAFGNTTSILTDQWGNRLKLTDPDAGVIKNTYNGFGQMLTQTDAKGTETSYTYDGYGRKTQISMSNSGETTSILYTYNANNRMLVLETMQPENTSIAYNYDNLMRLTGKTYTANNQSLSYKYTYNNIGQLEDVTYPFGFKIKHEYDSYGRLQTIRNFANGYIIYSVKQYDAKWQTPQLWRAGTKLGTVEYRNEAGLLTKKQTGIGNMQPPNSFSLIDNSIQSHEYEYDNAGRMTMRADKPVEVFIGGSYAYDDYQNKEYFFHDQSDRLTNANLANFTGLSTLSPSGKPQYTFQNYNFQNLFNIAYDQNRIASNSSVGNYSYDHPQPHALSNVELSVGNENAISPNKCETSYNLFNKIKTIEDIEEDYLYSIRYFPNKNQAVSTLEQNGTVIFQKQYAGKAFEIETDNENNEKKYFYVYAYGQPVAVFIQNGEGNPVPYYIHTDHLGSIDVITDQYGDIVDEMSFDAWGNRRDRYDWSQPEGNVVHLIDRGFTGHQHLDIFDLINMGGRVYDPTVQQFLSPDPYVQMPDNTQNLNRYAYCMNSPLMYTDPTGEQMAYSWNIKAMADAQLASFSIMDPSAPRRFSNEEFMRYGFFVQEYNSWRTFAYFDGLRSDAASFVGGGGGGSGGSWGSGFGGGGGGGGGAYGDVIHSFSKDGITYKFYSDGAISAAYNTSVGTQIDLIRRASSGTHGISFRDVFSGGAQNTFRLPEVPEFVKTTVSALDVVNWGAAVKYANYAKYTKPVARILTGVSIVLDVPTMYNIHSSWKNGEMSNFMYGWEWGKTLIPYAAGLGGPVIGFTVGMSVQGFDFIVKTATEWSVQLNNWGRDINGLPGMLYPY